MAISDVEVRHVDIDVEAAYADAEGMLEAYPWRGPAAVAHGLRPYIEGKVVCDLGCGGGDLVCLMGRWAERAIGVERGNRYEIAKQQESRADNVSIHQFDYFEQPIPDADVYYCWPNDPVHTVHLIAVLTEQHVPTTLIMGSRLIWIECEREGRPFTYGTGNVRTPNFLSLLSKHGGEIVSFPYREPKGRMDWPDEDTWCLTVLELGQ